jgi:hypothetical protein
MNKFTKRFIYGCSPCSGRDSKPLSLHPGLLLDQICSMPKPSAAFQSKGVILQRMKVLSTEWNVVESTVARMIENVHE